MADPRTDELQAYFRRSREAVDKAMADAAFMAAILSASAWGYPPVVAIQSAVSAVLILRLAPRVGADPHARPLAELRALPNVTLRRATMATGLYDHGYLLAREALADHAPDSGLPRQRQRPLARRADRADVQRRDERPCLKALLLPALGARRLVQIEHGQLSKIVTARARSRLISVMSP